MKAQELRIGNWHLKNERGVLVEKQITIQDLVLLHNTEGLTLNGYSPIPLTEEWFIKFGAEITGRNGHVFKTEVHMPCKKQMTGLIPIRLIYIEYGEGKQWVIEFGGYDGTEEVVIGDSVHELQNFWYAIEREELEIKE